MAYPLLLEAVLAELIENKFRIITGIERRREAILRHLSSRTGSLTARRRSASARMGKDPVREHFSGPFRLEFARPGASASARNGMVDTNLRPEYV